MRVARRVVHIDQLRELKPAAALDERHVRRDEMAVKGRCDARERLGVAVVVPAEGDEEDGESDDERQEAAERVAPAIRRSRRDSAPQPQRTHRGSAGVEFRAPVPISRMAYLSSKGARRTASIMMVKSRRGARQRSAARPSWPLRNSLHGFKTTR
eukprot:6739367-Prymnesium_polylepis.1